MWPDTKLAIAKWASAIAFYVTAAVVLWKGKPESWWLAFWCALVVPIVVGFMVLLFEHVGEWLKTKQRCEHRIRSGESGRCEICKAKKQQEAQHAAERSRIISESRALELREKRRLSKAWLSHAESYFTMESQEFENAIAALFVKLDYKVQQTPFSNDGGKDAIAWKDDKKYLIECKRYAENQSIGRRDLQILVAAMLEEKAVGGIYVNTGRFTETAIAYALQNRIDLYDRGRLPTLVNTAYGVPIDATRADVMCTECGRIESLTLGSTGTCQNGHQIANNLRVDASVLGSLEPPKCKKCGYEMRMVKGPRGPFWGCSRYPTCKSSQPITSRDERFRRRAE